uniref:Exocyst complex component 3-like 1 n=1 Tax=Paramormyrops kingsleyae TaxID=1676925 RepID=A0A3B3SUL5_9TELE|nr:exocyst complex component 3-like protein isoform X1 [Paramormyrops kingsleyae]
MSVDGVNNGNGNSEDALPIVEVWPELERAEQLARGAALKWASGVFSRPEQLEKLGQYRMRERQRTESIHSRLKSMVQTYLEGIDRGLKQLREARLELKEVSCSLAEVKAEGFQNAEGTETLAVLRGASISHAQLLAAVSNLPRLHSVRGVVLETERLVESRRLLEAHTHLMELERWQDEVLWQLGVGGAALDPRDEELVRTYFSDVGRLVEALARELWAVVGSGLALARQNPTSFVSAVRIVEREEALDRALLEERRGGGCTRPLPPGRPRCWRKRFFQVMDEMVSSRFCSVSYLHTRGSGLANHLSGLQHSIMGDVATVQHLLEQCVPPHYRLLRVYVATVHRCLQTHLAQVSSWDLERGEIFAVLNWVLHVYGSHDMLGHPDVVSEMDPLELGPLISPETLEKLQSKYVYSIRNSVADWMNKALEVELTDWQRDQEPDVDHEGFYHTSLPTIIAQMLQENAQVALMISESLRDQTIHMGLYELESFLNRFREALVEFGKEHRKDHGRNPFYLHYLLATISNCIVLKGSTESLQQQCTACPTGCFSWPPTGPLVALDRAVKKACRLVMDRLLLELQPLLLRLLSGSWLTHGEVTPLLCRVLERHCELYGHVRPPCRQRLQEECQRLVVVEYVRALMQRRLVCRGAGERHQVAERIVQDAQLLRDVFQDMEGEGSVSGVTPSVLLPILAEIIRLQDPSLLILEVSGLVAKYPDISEEHVSVLLDVRGDVPRELRGVVLDMLEQSTPILPPGYRPVFSDILVPPRSMSFCLPTARCS